ncbi:MAG TPA: hypothetical protein VF458_05635 [Ktedonobacteraceae bacterium]
MITLTELTYALHSASPVAEHNQLGPSARVNLMVGFTYRSTTNAPSTGFTYVRLPVSAALITFLENQRMSHPEHAVSAFLHLQPTLAWLEQTGNVTPDEYGNHPFIGEQTGPFSRLSYFWYPQAGDLAIQIAASDWVQHVLPGLGYNQARFVEITLPTASGFFPEAILGYYDTARRHLDLGNYREAIASCRDIRNTVEGHLGATRANPVGTVVADRLGLPADAPQRALLNATWDALAMATNTAHHLPGGPRLTGADARMCLHLTAVVLDYLTHLR